MDSLEYLKRNVFPGESGGDYNALFGYSNRPGGQFGGVNLTDMTVGQAVEFSNPSGPYGQWVKGQVGRVATPMGAYQVVGTTLRAAMKGLGLTGNEKMTPELQDQIGMWIYQNQGPGAWEAWGKGGGGGGSVVKSTKGGAPVNGLLDMGQMPEEDQGGIIRLLTGQNKPWASRLNDIGAVLLALSGSPAAQPLLSQIEKRKDRKAQSAKDNKTLAWLASQGRDDLVAAVQGGLPVGNAIQMAMQPPPQPPGPEIREVDGRLVAINPDMSVTELYGSAPAASPQSSIAKLQADLSAGLITQEQYDVALANMAPPGMVIESDGAGGFRMVQGAGAGAAGGKPFTEGQSKDNVYATRALGALEVLEPIAGNLTSLSSRTAEYDPTGFIRGKVQSPEYQVAKNAGDEFLQAILRKDTGAAITQGEQELYGQTYLPQPGDGPEVLDAKKAARRRAVDAIQAGMSPAQMIAIEKALGGVGGGGAPQSGPVKVANDAEYNALPSGTEFIGPDGKLRRKP
jgi:hypothetical protein